MGVGARGGRARQPGSWERSGGVAAIRWRGRGRKPARAPGGLKSAVGSQAGTCTQSASASSTLEGREAGSSVPWTACAPGSPGQEATGGILSRAGSLSDFAWKRRAGGAPKWACQGDKLGGERGPREKEGGRKRESKCDASGAEEGPGDSRSRGPYDVPDGGNEQTVQFKAQTPV